MPGRSIAITLRGLDALRLAYALGEWRADLAGSDPGDPDRDADAGS
jgi:hypothetical protein